MRLRDIATRLGITERRAFGIVADLTQAGYVAKLKEGRRNHYQIQAELPLLEPASGQRTIGEFLAVLAGTGVSASPPGQQDTAANAAQPARPPTTPADSVT